MGPDRVAYNILELVRWAEQNCKLKRIPTKDLVHEFEGDNQSEEPDGSPEFLERASQSEDYPIVIQRDIFGVLRVMDGRHRLCKALTLDRPYIEGYIIPVEDLPVEAIHIVSDEDECLVV